MTISAVAKSLSDWGSLSCTSPSLMLPGQPCRSCGTVHFTGDHSQFMQTMPEDPVDMVDDLVKMGIYKENQLRAADTVNAYELRKALFLKRVGRSDPQREKLILALCQQAGGLENAFAAAFGPQAGMLSCRLGTQQRCYSARIFAQHGGGGGPGQSGQLCRWQ
jgi:nitrate/nitrite transport system substrate-binding protein